MLDGIGRALAYPKIRRRLNWDQETISRYSLLLRFKTEVVDIGGVTAERASCRWPSRAASRSLCAEPTPRPSAWCGSLGDRPLTFEPDLDLPPGFALAERRHEPLSFLGTTCANVPCV